MRERNDFTETSKKYFKSVLLELNLTESNIFSDRGTILFSFTGRAYMHQRQQWFNYKRFEEYNILNDYFWENDLWKTEIYFKHSIA